MIPWAIFYGRGYVSSDPHSLAMLSSCIRFSAMPFGSGNGGWVNQRSLGDGRRRRSRIIGSGTGPSWRLKPRWTANSENWNPQLDGGRDKVRRQVLRHLDQIEQEVYEELRKRRMVR